jgi:uncharacterized protein (TIGR00251 family)
MPSRVIMSAHRDGTLLDVWAVPGARRSEIVGTHDGALRVRIAAAPEDGKANRAVAKLLKRELEAPGVYLERGSRSRRKQFVIEGLIPDEVATRLAARN